MEGVLELPFDGGDELVTDLTLAAFGNTRRYGGGMLIWPDADHSDGLLDALPHLEALATALLTAQPQKDPT